MLVMEAMERIEVSIRSQWANELAQEYGSHAHMLHEAFKCPWTHLADLSRMATPLKEQNKETFIEHYRRKYTQPFLPHIWAIIETLSLGALSRWVKNTKDLTIKKRIAKNLGLPTADLLEEILHTLTPLRNVCAHHSRLWNKSFPMQIPVIKKLHNNLISNNTPNAHHIFNFLVVIAYMMQHISPNSSWSKRLKILILEQPKGTDLAMGFPKDWQTRSLWTAI